MIDPVEWDDEDTALAYAAIAFDESEGVTVSGGDGSAGRLGRLQTPASL